MANGNGPVTENRVQIQASLCRLVGEMLGLPVVECLVPEGLVVRFKPAAETSPAMNVNAQK